MKKRIRHLTILTSALQSGQMVRIVAKPTPDTTLDGYVVSLSETFVLLHLLDGGFHMALNGYTALPLSEIKKIRLLDDDNSFADRALKVKGIFPKPQLDLLLLDFPGLLSSADAHFPLVTIHLERLNRDCCFIGRVEKLTKKSLQLQKIDASAQWAEMEKFRFEDITRIDFGGGYEEALWLVNQNERAAAAAQGTDE